jgi:protein SEY1
MDAMTGRQQTTHGIWLARSPKVAAPTTLVMDLEGSDGRERGEDDTSFERQSALFALATADILLVNMWAKDVGREAGAGKPLLKTIFQVNLKLFQPSPGARRTVLLFVLRDRTKTPLDKLKETWEADLNRMWMAIAKPAAYENSQISDFFEIQYAALSNYEDRTDEFMAETTLLRRRFTDDADDYEGLLRQSPHKLPGQALALSMGKVWEVIHENKDLNLPAHRVMVANIRCEEIAAEQAAAFESNSTWQSLAADAQEDLVPNFGTKTAELLDAALAAYDDEARYFDAGVSAAKQEALVEQLQNFVKPSFDTQMALACGIAMDSFRLGIGAPSSSSSGAGDKNPTISGGSATTTSSTSTNGTDTFVAKAAHCTATALSEFDAAAAQIVIPGVEWTAASARESLQRELAAHQAALRAEHVAAVLDKARETVENGVSAGAMPLLESPPVDLWPRLAAVVDRESKAASTVLAKALQGYGIDAAEEGELRSRVRASGKGRLLANAKEAANTALPRLKDRFSETFQKDDQGMPRTWAPAVDIPAVAAESKRAAALLLSQLCTVRLGSSTSGGGSSAPATASKVLITPTGTAKSVDVVDTAIMRLAEFSSSKTSGLTAAAAAAAAAKTSGSHAATEFDLISASEWPGVAKEDVLLTPAQARTVWRQFSSDIALSVQQAVATQEANKLAQNRLPPLWAIIAMIFLGFNEFVAVLRNPLLLIFIVILVMFGRTVYNELDVEAEMSRGLLPGVMALSSKFMPVVTSVTLRTIEQARVMLSEGGGHYQEEGSDTTPPRGGGGGGAGGGGRLRNGSGNSARVRFDTPEIGNGGGLRARKKDIELTPSGTPVVGGDLLGGNSTTDNNRKDI